MKYLVLIFINLTFFICGNLSAQIITGNVVDSQKQPVDMITVTTHYLKDSTLISGDFFINSFFDYESNVKPPYFIKISRLGYNPLWYKIDKSILDTIHLGTIVMQMKKNLLDEVQITAKVKMVEHDVNGVTVNVANTPLRNMESLTEVMQNAPGVVTDHNGNIDILGRGNPLILVNGKEFYGGSILQVYKPSDIKEIKIIRNPGAKYKAAHRSVLNVIARKKISEEWAGWIYDKVEHGENIRNNSQVLLNRHTKKSTHMLNLNSNIGTERNRENLFSTIFFEDTANFYNKYNSDNNKEIYSGKLMYVFGHDFNKDNTIGFRYNNYISESDIRGSFFNEITQGDSYYYSITSLNEDEKSIGNAINVNYSFSPDSVSKFLVVADYSNDKKNTENSQISRSIVDSTVNNFGNDIDYNIAVKFHKVVDES